MKVVVAGGNGFLGRQFTIALSEAGHDVTVLSRRKPHETPGENWVAGDVTRPDGLKDALAGADAVIDAVQFPKSPVENPKKGYTFEQVDLQGTKNLVDAARAANVAHFVDISGTGAAQTARYHWLRFKWQEEQYIIGSGVPYTIFRPSWVFGPGDVSLNRFLGFARFLPFIPVIGGGSRISPLFVNDLAAHVVAAVAAGPKSGTFEIGGPSVLTMNEIVRTALKVAGKRRFLLPQPASLMKVVASAIQHAPGRPLTPDAIDFITMDGPVDNTVLIAAFGLPLTTLEDGLATYL
jgi:NADH dehydrogenase